MVGKEDAPCGGEGNYSRGDLLHGPCDTVGARKLFWRSASWSSSRPSMQPLNPESDCGKDFAENVGQGGWVAGPLTPRSQNSFKARSCLPPLQPLSIARRSLDEWPKAGSDDSGEWPLPGTPRGKNVNNNGERLKLDLSNIQRDSDRNGGLVKREKIAFFDKECSKVAEHVYLGGDAVARDRDILKQHKITHILNCVGFVSPEYFKSDFAYRTLWLQDSPSEDITSILYDVFDYFEDVGEMGGKVFVHCCQGVSRSTSLVIAYLMWREGQSFDDAFQYVKAARSIADPNMGFACQLIQCQKRVHAFPLSPSSLLRMYWMAPHSPYDPLHLVPKILNDPSPSALDSRGAFIIQVPSAIYLWIGKKCELIMERDARGAVCQIVRYEKVQGPIVMIQEGEEPSCFWDAFSSLLPLTEKSRERDSTEPVVDRKVDVYDVDFEIFQKAITGGFFPPFASAETEEETHLPARESSWSALRCKSVSGSMKEFVLSTAAHPYVVYPQSLFAVDKQCPTKLLNSLSNLCLASQSSVSSTSSSPPYLSPDSISSDASFTSASAADSPVVSPSEEELYASVTSSLLSNLPSMMLLSSRLSPSIDKSSKFIDVNFNSDSCLRSASVPCKKSPLSIAERRGSLLKSLKLRMSNDYSVGRNIVPSCHIDNQGLISGFENVCMLGKFQDPEDLSQSMEQELMHQDMKVKMCLGRLELSDSVDASGLTFDQRGVDHQCLENESVVFKGLIDYNFEPCDLKRPTAFRWPSLEKIMSFNGNDMDSHSAFVFITPSVCLGKTGGTILYLWLGKFFNPNKRSGHFEHNGKLQESKEVEWTAVNSDILSQMLLPKDIRVEEAALKVRRSFALVVQTLTSD